MKTLEQAIRDIEWGVSGIYSEAFPDSRLRKDTKNAVEFLRFNLETIAKTSNMSVKKLALGNIFDTVLDDHQVPEHVKGHLSAIRDDWNLHSLIRYPNAVERCIESCEVIINRLKEDDAEEDDISVSELSKKYEGKWLYFNGDENGCQWVWVRNIHRDRKRNSPVLCVDGVMLDYNGEIAKFRISPIEDKDFSDFHYFTSDDSEKYAGFTRCSSLDRELMSRPIDTNLPSHVVEGKDVVNEVITLFAWEFEHGYGTSVPGMSEIFESLKEKL